MNQTSGREPRGDFLFVLIINTENKKSITRMQFQSTAGKGNHPQSSSGCAQQQPGPASSSPFLPPGARHSLWRHSLPRDSPAGRPSAARDRVRKREKGEWDCMRRKLVAAASLTPSMSGGHGAAAAQGSRWRGAATTTAFGSGEHAADAHTQGMLTGIWSVFVFDCNSRLDS